MLTSLICFLTLWGIETNPSLAAVRVEFLGNETTIGMVRRSKYPDKKRQQQLEANVKEVHGYLEESDGGYPEYLAWVQLGMLYDDEANYYTTLLEGLQGRKSRKYGETLRSEIIAPLLQLSLTYYEQAFILAEAELKEQTRKYQRHSYRVFLSRLIEVYQHEFFPIDTAVQFEVSDLKQVLEALEEG